MNSKHVAVQVILTVLSFLAIIVGYTIAYPIKQLMIYCDFAGNLHPGEYNPQLSYSYFIAIAVVSICFVMFNRMIKNKIIDIILLAVSIAYIIVHVICLYNWNALNVVQTIIWDPDIAKNYTAQVVIDVIAVVALIDKLMRYRAQNEFGASAIDGAASVPDGDLEQGDNKKRANDSNDVPELNTVENVQSNECASSHNKLSRQPISNKWMPLAIILGCVIIGLSALCLYLYNKYTDRNRDYNTEISLYNDVENKYSDLKDQYDSLTDEYDKLNEKYESLQKDYDSLSNSGNSDEEAAYNSGYDWGVQIGYRFGYIDGQNGNDPLY